MKQTYWDWTSAHTQTHTGWASSDVEPLHVIMAVAMTLCVFVRQCVYAQLVCLCNSVLCILQIFSDDSFSRSCWLCVHQFCLHSSAPIYFRLLFFCLCICVAVDFFFFIFIFFIIVVFMLWGTILTVLHTHSFYILLCYIYVRRKTAA